MATNDGGPAFPVDGFPGDNFFPQVQPHTGMTMRDYFAAQALAGLLAGRGLVVRDGIPVVPTKDSLAVAAWEMSDAMLAAREGGAK